MKVKAVLIVTFLAVAWFAGGLSARAMDIVVGSQDTAVADPPVPRPDAAPTVVTLFTDMEFADWSVKNFSYVPPPDCPGPWGKVVLVADFRVTEGVQYDRTCQFTIGRVNVYYGTTPEPSPDFGPTWHVERDLTDYTALLMDPQDGEAFLGNIVNDTYTGVIYGTARLEFYHVSSVKKPPEVADAVLPLRDSSGGAALLNYTDDKLSRTFDLPSNVEKAYLDVFAQAQHYDEFWYTCVPDDLAGDLQSCGNTPFRETQVLIDGIPAGIAPVYPWIFTGCIDPYLWAPIPGVQTINFVPYRVDLTPFAALLSDGQPHTVAIYVYNAYEWFLADAALLLFYDDGSTQVTGELTENTLASAGGPIPMIADSINITDDSITGEVSVTSNRAYTISGWVRTSQGKVKTKVKSSVSFSNVQQFNIDNDNYIQDITQNTVIVSKSATTKGDSTSVVKTSLEFPLSFDIYQQKQSDGKINLLLAVDQKYNEKKVLSTNGKVSYNSTVENEMFTTDTLVFNSFGQYRGHKDQNSYQRFKAKDNKGYCWDRYVETLDGFVTAVEDGCR